MADEKNRDQNQGSERNEKAMGATATGGTQGQQGQGQTDQKNYGRNPSEAPGQGGGVQGQGQRNPSQGQDKDKNPRGEDFRQTGGGAREGGSEV